MFSKESCDTEDWSIDFENSALPSQDILKYTDFTLLLYFITILLYEINAALVSLNTSFQKWQKIKINNKKYWPKTLNCSVCITYLCIFTFNSKSISTMPNPTNFILIKMCIHIVV